MADCCWIRFPATRPKPALLPGTCLLLQRIVTNLQEVVAARGLTLPQQVLAGGSGSGRAGGSDDSSATASAGGLPLNVLLGGSLVDRMDLLGRTGGRCSAAASGLCSVHVLLCG